MSYVRWLRKKVVLNKFIALESLNTVVYFRLKDGSLKLADLDNKASESLKLLYLNHLNHEMLNKKDLKISLFSQHDDRKNVIYEYDFNETIQPLDCIKVSINSPEQLFFDFNTAKIIDIDAVLVVLKNSNNYIAFYSKVYPPTFITQSKVLKLIPSHQKLSVFDGELLQFNGKFDVVYYDDIFIIVNHSILEKFYKFNELIIKKAKSCVSSKIMSSLIMDKALLESLIHSDISFSRKFVKAMQHSKVIQKCIPVDSIINFVRKHNILSHKLKFNTNNTKFILPTKTACKHFIKLLDDDYLYSELTGTQYDAVAKDDLKI